MTEGAGCARCGAAMRPRQQWCSLCLAPGEPLSGPPPVVVASPRRYSRRHGGVTSYGLRGRLLATAATVLVPLVMLATGSFYSLAFALLWTFTAGPVVLRDVWKRERVD